ncbi:MAG: aminotransferase class I/II-fold pyridoxal phosphate-dependent enzyme [Marinilabiliales bacterium]|nr:aminotransferase class I/II-fold pyridoxal phosphate-dependent enzyme [Marinilabiliales bacterium]
MMLIQRVSWAKPAKGLLSTSTSTVDDKIFQTETMSKALGGYGGFISGSKELTEMIRERSATYQASTALPPPIAAAGIASLANHL